MGMKKFKTVDEYINAQPPKSKVLLKVLRKTILENAPECVEVISYNMPAFKFLGRILVYFAAHTNHIGFYPGSVVVADIFKKELTSYKTSKGTIQFPLDKKISIPLVKKIVKYRVKQNLEKVGKK